MPKYLKKIRKKDDTEKCHSCNINIGFGYYNFYDRCSNPKGRCCPSRFFLKIEGIDGESKDTTHGGEIEVLSWSFGASQTGTYSTGGAGTGKVVFQDFHFTKTVDKSSPKLAQALATGEHIQSLNLTVRKAGGDRSLEYLKIKLSDCIVASYSVHGGGPSEGDIPMENISFNFSKIEFEYTEQKEDGSAGATTRMGWDLAKNIRV